METLDATTTGSTDWSNLPEEIVQVLGLHLDARAWAAARAVCRAWKNITGDIRLLEIDLERDAHRWMMVLTCVARLFPRLSCIVLLMGNRITPTAFAERMAALSITCVKLQELELRFVYLSNPLIGSWLEDLSGVTELRALRVLRLAGGATPPPAFFASLSCLRCLSVLEVMPGVYGQMFNDLDVDMASAHAQGLAGVDGGLCDAHLAAIGQLTQLKQLTVKVCPGEVTPAGLSGLSGSGLSGPDLSGPGLMASLEQLALYDSELPAACLAGWLQGAGRLTALQLGLSNVDDLAPLARLPKLKALSLDTAFLPDLRELVYSAARGNIPTSGPGALTGLCLLDQTVNSPLQLASLSQLSSLAELVLSNPMREPPTAPDDDQDDAEPPQLQPQQPAIEITALSGLRSLQLLQIDLKHYQQLNPELDIVIPEPLNLTWPVAAVQQLAAIWTGLVTLDLSGFGPDRLSEEAVAGFSSFKSLRHLSIMTLEGSEARGQAGQQGLAVQQQPRTRRLAWWQLPKGLATLCLSHFDLSGSSSSRNGGGGIDAAESGGAATAGATNSSEALTACGSSSCCMAPLPQPQQQQQRKQQSPPVASGLSSRVQQLINPRTSPLRPLGKRRRQNEQQQQQEGEAEGAAVGVAHSSSSEGSDIEAATEAAAAAAAVAAGAAAAAAARCPCADRVSSHFSSLQALWLEHCSLPRNFLALCLPAAASSLESLALLQVCGSTCGEVRLVSGLSGLTSLRLAPQDHSLEGLEQLTPLRHLRKLNVKLTHLQPSDLSVLPQLRSLFGLSLSAPLLDGQVRPGLACAVRAQQVVDVVRESLPYCDVELQHLSD